MGFIESSYRKFLSSLPSSKTRRTVAKIGRANGHGALAGFLMEMGVDTLICGGIGGGAQNALMQAGIKLYGGVSGNADEAAKALASGTLEFNPDVQCNHHGHHSHGAGHSCGDHGCHH